MRMQCSGSPVDFARACEITARHFLLSPDSMQLQNTTGRNHSKSDTSSQESTGTSQVRAGLTGFQP